MYIINDTLKALGYKTLRDWQRPVVEHLLNGGDTMLIAPTAAGKSLVYALVAKLLGGLTIVISPLLALQVDQVESMQMKGVSAALLNSSLSTKQREDVLQSLPSMDMLYLAPEQLKSEYLQQALCRCQIKFIVLDEAHFLPQSELNFRTAYGKIGDFISGLPEQPLLLACTATATAKERKRIAEALGMQHPKEFLFPVRRPNLRLSCKKISGGKKTDLTERLFHLVESELTDWNQKGSVIIYCTTVQQVKELHKWLKSREFQVAKYHGQMRDKKRKKNQHKFMVGLKNIMIATNAFGVGIDKPNVRLLIHVGLPLSFSGYIQEIGRAGRNDKKSRCVLYYSPSDYDRNKRILSYGNGTKDQWSELDAMVKYARSDKCAWRLIEMHLQNYSGDNCGHCSACQRKHTKLA